MTGQARRRVITTAAEAAALGPGVVLARPDSRYVAVHTPRPDGTWGWRYYSVHGPATDEVEDDADLFPDGVASWEVSPGDPRPVDVPTAVRVLVDVAVGRRRGWPDLMDAATILLPLLPPEDPR